MLELRSEKGQGLAEYGLILVLIAVVVVAVLTLLGEQVSGLFDTVQNSIPVP